MNLLNKIKKYVITAMIFSFSLITIGVNAEENVVTEMFKIESCANLKAGFQSIAKKANTEDADTKDLRFNYIDALNCNTAILDKNIFTTVNYIIFGDAMLYANELASSVVKNVFGFNDMGSINFTDKFLESADLKKVKPLTETVTVISAVAKMMTIVSIFLLILFFVFYIYNSSSDGEMLGSGASLAWVIARVGITLGLMLPLDSIGGFAPIQILVLTVAVFGNLLGNVVSFMMPVFEFLDRVDVEKVEFDNSVSSYSKVSEIIDETIASHICDIQARKNLTLFQETTDNYKSEIIGNNEFLKCINESYENTEYVATLNKNYEKPFDLAITESCAIKVHNLVVECSKNSINFIEDTYDQLTGELISNPIYGIAENIRENNSEYRDIAQKSIFVSCLDLKKITSNRSYDYKNTCTIFNGREFSFKKTVEKEAVIDADGNIIKPAVENEEIMTYDIFNSDDESYLYRDLALEAMENEINKIKKSVYKSYITLAKNQILDMYVNDKSVILEEKLGFSLIKGWLSSSSFMLDAGQNIAAINSRYRNVFSSLKFTSGRNGVYQKISNNGYIKFFYRGSPNGDDNHTNIVNDYNKNTESTKSTMHYKLISGEDRSDMYLTDNTKTSVIMKIFFPGIINLKKLSGGNILSDSNKDSCISDFNNCRSAGVNPLKDVIEMGSDMMGTGMVFAVGAKGVSSVLGYLAFNLQSKTFSFGAELTSLFGTLFMLYMILGMALLYLPSLIIFAYFLGNAIGWVSNVFVFTIISSLWVAMHLFPENGKGFAGKASYGYTKLLDILLRPTFIVFGVFVTFVISSVMISILNVLFALTINTFELFNTPNNFMEFIMNYIVYIIYVILVIVVLLRSAKAIYKVPNALMDWFNFENDENQGVWNQMSSYFTYSVTSVLAK